MPVTLTPVKNAQCKPGYASLVSRSLFACRLFVVSSTTAALPVAPADLSPESVAAWPGLVADLAALGRGAEVDLSLLADVLRARDRLTMVSAKLTADGPIVTGSRNQPRPHPLLDAEAGLRKEIASGFDRLGLSQNRREWTVSVDGAGRICRTA